MPSRITHSKPLSRHAFRVGLLPVAFAAALMATGCGGGGEASTTPVAEAQSPNAPKPAGILYALTPVTGLVGKAMLEQGWTVREGLPPDGDAGALVYIDSSNKLANAPNVLAVAGQRRGALLIDSQQASPGTVVIHSPDDESRGQLLSAYQAGDSTFKPMSELQAKFGELTDAMRYQRAMGRPAAALATAVLIGPESVTPLHYLADGSLNNLPGQVGYSAIDATAVRNSWDKFNQQTFVSAVARPANAPYQGTLNVWPSVDMIFDGSGYLQSPGSPLVSRSRLKVASTCSDPACQYLYLAALNTTGEKRSSGSVNPYWGYPLSFKSSLAAPSSNATDWSAPAIVSHSMGVCLFPDDGNPDQWNKDTYNDGPKDLVDPNMTEDVYANNWTLSDGVGRSSFDMDWWSTASFKASVPYLKASKRWTSVPSVFASSNSLCSGSALKRVYPSDYVPPAGRYINPSDFVNRQPSRSAFLGLDISNAASFRTANGKSFYNNPNKSVTMIFYSTHTAHNAKFSRPYFRTCSRFGCQSGYRDYWVFGGTSPDVTYSAFQIVAGTPGYYMPPSSN